MENARSVVMPVVPYRKRPATLRKPIVLGVHKGSCVSGYKIGTDVVAHAHTDPADDFHGWLCFRDTKALKNVTVCLHELAHLESGQYYHNTKWRAKLIELGGSLKGDHLIKSYVPLKRVRKKVD